MQIEHIMGDDALDPAQGIKVARKFTSDELMYGVIGPPVSHIAQASLKIYGQKGPGLYNHSCIQTGTH